MAGERYRREHPRCAVCHWPEGRWGRRLELHHIIGGAGRKNPKTGINWLMLCNRCHRAVHDRLPVYGELKKGCILTAKAEEDGVCDPTLLAALTGRKALSYESCPIPQMFLDDRDRKGGDVWPQ